MNMAAGFQGHLFFLRFFFCFAGFTGPAVPVLGWITTACRQAGVTR
jgi:hypothetical protein